MNYWQCAGCYFHLCRQPEMIPTIGRSDWIESLGDEHNHFAGWDHPIHWEPEEDTALRKGELDCFLELTSNIPWSRSPTLLALAFVIHTRVYSDS